MQRLLITGIGIVAVALLALGCGGSGDEGETVQALTKPQFIKQADEACEKVAEKREAAAKSWHKEHPGEVDAEELSEAFKEVLVPAIQEQVDALEALGPPVADRAKVARMLDNLTKAQGDFEQEGAEGTRQPEVSQFETEARKYGLKVCPQLY